MTFEIINIDIEPKTKAYDGLKFLKEFNDKSINRQNFTKLMVHNLFNLIVRHNDKLPFNDNFDMLHKYNITYEGDTNYSLLIESLESIDKYCVIPSTKHSFKHNLKYLVNNYDRFLNLVEYIKFMCKSALGKDYNNFVMFDIENGIYTNNKNSYVGYNDNIWYDENEIMEMYEDIDNKEKVLFIIDLQSNRYFKVSG